MHLACLSVLLNPMVNPPSPDTLPREFRAAWVATVANIDWPSRPGLTTEQQRKEMRDIIDLASAQGLNALIWQIRPMADALYESKLEPWSYYLTGQQGKAPNPRWDPLQEMIAYAHSRGIELHVWFNPYRAGHPTFQGSYDPRHISQLRPDLVYKYGTFLWMDPAAAEVQRESLNVMMDVVSRYDIDGIHIDDYFYPYPVRENGQEVPFPDQARFAAYQRGGGTMNLGDWRRDHVNRFVKAIHEGTKQRKPWVKFGISPFGVYRPGVPQGITAGVDQYAQLYADALLWYQQGWCDYFTPQLYWPIEQTPQSFPVLLNWWRSQNTKDIHLWPGLFTSRLNPSDGNWEITQVERQIALTRQGDDNPGHVHFSFKAMIQDWKGLRGSTKRMYAEPALVPASPWMDRTVPAAPRPTRTGNTVAWAKAQNVRFYAVSTFDGTKWTVRQVNNAASFTAPVGTKAVAVYAISRTGMASPAGTVQF